MIGLGLAPLADDLVRLGRLLPLALESGLAEALELGLLASRARLRPGGGGPVDRSGRLSAGLAARVRPEAGGWRGELTSPAPFAAAQENGAVIQARRAKYLHFRVQGRWVRVRRVALPPRPFLGPGLAEAARRLPEILTRRLEELLP